MCFVQALFQFFCAFSGSSFLTSFSLTTYNVLFTALPIIFYCLDKDLEDSLILRNRSLTSLFNN